MDRCLKRGHDLATARRNVDRIDEINPPGVTINCALQVKGIQGRADLRKPAALGSIRPGSGQ
jgi:hypothetical protein